MEGVFKYQLALQRPSKQSLLEIIGSLKPVFHEESNIVVVAVCMGAGIAAYFSMPYELPAAFVVFMGLLAASLALRFAKVSRAVAQSLMFVFIFCAGFSIADLRSDRVAAPLMPEIADYYSLSGTIDERLTDSKGQDRLVISGLEVDELSADETPAKIRIQVRTAIDSHLGPGDRVQLDANLSAPQGPVAAGSFNFARNDWFNQIGGVGFAISAISSLSEPSPDSSKLNAIRHKVGQRLSGQMSPREGALATALLTGDRSALPREVVNEMRDAGLAHLLAISGLHMGLVSATIFFMVEAMLALWPSLALRVPSAKIAAVVAWVSALGYLALSGMGVSTIRAFLMVSIALVGILLDRRAISLRSIALAAITIMLIWPETLVSVGFQMSFAAVTALVVFYDTWGRKLMFGGFTKGGKRLGFMQKLAGVFIAAVMTTLVAELAIAPIALYHFQSMALYGLLANIIAVPLMSFLVMPLLLLTLLLMPFGLEWLVLPLVEPCLTLMMSIAAEVSGLPGSTLSVPQLPFVFIGMALIVAFLLTLVRGRINYGLVPLGLLLMLYASQHTNEPDIYISREGKILAIKQTSGLLAFNSNRHSYQKDAWRRLNGEGADVSQPLPRLAQSCDAEGCLYSSDRKDIPSIARVTSLAGLMSECGRSDIIIAEGVSGRYCRSGGLVLDYKRLDAGPISLWIEDGKVQEMKTRTQSLGQRPWIPAVLD